MDQRQITEFWNWFEGVSHALPNILDDKSLFRELEDRVDSLGDIGWEIGPPVSPANEWMFVLSPDGKDELLDLTQRVISQAPNLDGWEFHPAKPPKTGWGRKFNLRNKNGSKTEIDASNWTYGLFVYKDGMVEIIFRSQDNPDIDEARRKTAAWIVVDAELGEECAIKSVCGAELVNEFTGEFARLADSEHEIDVLQKHISKLVSDR